MNSSVSVNIHSRPSPGESLLQPPRRKFVGGLGQAVSATLETMKPSPLIERLIERLGSTQDRLALYTAALTKAVAVRDAVQLDLERICSDERQHCDLIRRHLVRLGFDAAFTPPSRSSGTTHQVLRIISDSRTTVSQSLCALLGAELAAVGEWETLARAARDAREEAMAAEFDSIRAVAESHVQRLRDRTEGVAKA